MTGRVGVIGVGAMGEALLSRILLAGGVARAFDIADDRMRLAGEMGAAAANDVADAVRDAAFVHVFVRTDEEAMEVVAGPRGVAPAVAAGTMVLLHSTIMPETTRKIAAAIAGKGLRVMDVPVTSVPRVVAGGNAVFLMGGSDEDAAIATPWLRQLGKSVYHFGPLGSGNVAKIAKNLINANERIALAEVTAIASVGGIGVEQFLAMATAVDQGSTVSRWRSAFTMEGNTAVPRPASNLLDKDIGLAADLADHLGVEAPMTAAAAATAKVWVAGWKKEGK